MLAIICFIFALLFALFALYQYLGEHRLYIRLRDISENATNTTPKKKYSYQIPVPASLESLTLNAGLDAPWAAQAVLITKILLAILVFVFSLPEEGASTSRYILSVVFAIAAQMLPDLWLKQKAQNMLLQLRAQLPEVFDLLILCLQSGMSLDAALQRIAKEVQSLNKKLAKELQILCQKLPVVPDRNQVLSHFADSLPIKETRQFINLIQQSDEYGTPLVEGLRDLANHSRQLYELEMEERLGQLPARMTIPIMLFIIFPLIVLLAAPALYRLIDYLAA